MPPGACDAALEAFSPALDGELGQEEGRSFEAHLAACSRCAAAWAAYRRDLEDLGPSLARTVDGETPRRRFPAPPPPAGFAWAWARAGALVLAAASGVAFGLLVPWTAVGGAGGRLAPLRAAAPVATPCPWHRAGVADIERAVSYPVMARSCLGQAYELVEARVRRGARCGETVRLLYRGGEQSFTLEQHPGHSPVSCGGQEVLVGAHPGCMEGAGRGGTRLRWAQADRAFHLEGDVEPMEAVEVARLISEELEVR